MSDEKPNAGMVKLDMVLGAVTRLGAEIAALRADVAALKQAPRAAVSSRSASAAAGGGAVFPPYGRSKGQPVAGASAGDLEFYRNGCIRSLDDESKARWHDKERALLAAIDDEMSRQGGGAPAGDGPPPPTDDDAPPF